MHTEFSRSKLLLGWITLSVGTVWVQGLRRTREATARRLPSPGCWGTTPTPSSSSFRVTKWWAGLVPNTFEWMPVSFSISGLLLTILFFNALGNVKWQSFAVTAHGGLQPATRSIAYFANQLLPYLHAHFLIADEATRSLDVQVLI